MYIYIHTYMGNNIYIYIDIPTTYSCIYMVYTQFPDCLKLIHTDVRKNHWSFSLSFRFNFNIFALQEPHRTSRTVAPWASAVTSYSHLMEDLLMAGPPFVSLDISLLPSATGFWSGTEIWPNKNIIKSWPFINSILESSYAGNIAFWTIAQKEDFTPQFFRA